MNWKSPILWFFLGLVVVAGVTLISPPEATLGPNVRVVYLHGAWVWTSLAAFMIAALVGAISLPTGTAVPHSTAGHAPSVEPAFLLDHLSPTLPVGDGGQLERPLSG